MDLRSELHLTISHLTPSTCHPSMLARAVVARRLPLIAVRKLPKCEVEIARPLQWPIPPIPTTNPAIRFASTSSSTRWKARQSNDPYTRSSKLSELKSRAAFKLLEIDDKHRLFKRGDTVVDLGFAPGSWSQVAISKVQPGVGRVVGIDVIPAQPPRGVNALQGDFLSPSVREEMRKFVGVEGRGRVRSRGLEELENDEDGKDIVEMEKLDLDEEVTGNVHDGEEKKFLSQKEQDLAQGRTVNVVLSDMSAPWPLVFSTWIRSVSNPYRRMLNTSGVQARDHGGSMDLCMAALTFAFDTLITNGHFLCKFYTGAEDHAMELRLKKLFEKVHRIKPDATRKESKEAYFLGLRRKATANREEVLGDG